MRMGSNRMSTIRLVVVACVVATILPARGGDDWSAPPDSPQPPAGSVRLTGFAAPARKAILAPMQDGRIASYTIDEGAFVKAGQTLMRLEDRIQAARTQLAQAAAESTLEVDLARVKMEFAQVELEKVRELGRTDLASAKELRSAEATAASSKLEARIAEFQHGEARRNFELQSLVLGEMRIVAPFDGFVAQILKQPGEVVEAREGVLLLVQLDPLEVTVDCPVATWSQAEPGTQVFVQPVDGKSPPREGLISFASRVAEPASQTFKLKVRVSNPRHDWIAGLRVNVDLPPHALPRPAPPMLSAARGEIPPEVLP